VFNPLAPDRLVSVLSTVLRESAGWSRPLEPFQTGQLKSASSIGRFLAAEVAHGGPVLRDFRAAVRESLADAPAPDADLASFAEFLCDRLAQLRHDPDPAAEELRTALHGLLRDLTNAETDILLGTTKGDDS
jgi:hypothetical protein